MVEEGQPLVFHKGQCLFYEGHSPYGLFVLKSGRVRFQTSGECGKEHGWKSPSGGKVFGLRSFFDEIPYCCTCTALEDCEVLFISKTQLAPIGESV